MTADRPDLATLRADDRLLDRLGRGAPGEGDVEEMLAGWRAGLPTAGPVDGQLLDAVTAAVAGKRAARRRRRREHLNGPTPPDRRRERRTARVSLSAAAVVLIAGGAVTVSAAHAGPDSPLWPVTRAVYGDLAESRAAQTGVGEALAEARVEVGQGHYPEAERLLSVADSLVTKVREPADARRLRHDIATVRDLLPKPELPATSSANVPITQPTPPHDKDGRSGDDDKARKRTDDQRGGWPRDEDNRSAPGEDSGDRDRDDDRDGERKERPRAFPPVPEVNPGVDPEFDPGAALPGAGTTGN